MSSKPIKAVLLLGFGGADSLENVEPFIRNVLSGRALRPELIEKAKERYRLIGGSSPLLSITQAQANAIVEILNSRGGEYEYRAYVGMRYWHPFIKDAVGRIKEDGADEAVVAIMSPFQTLVATEGYRDAVKDAVKALGGTPQTVYLTEWHIHPRFIDSIVEKINEQLSAFQKREDALVIFSNHSLPVAALEGDPYELKIQQTIGEVLKKTGKIDYKAAYQSQGEGPREWKGPRTEDVIVEARKRKKAGVVVVPLGFVADHVETLYDIDIYFRKTAESLGLIFRRTSSLNTYPKFIQFLAELIRKQAERTR
ncbi:MAG: ferrochelatase [Deltaproteobacteria bacterium]|nr:ferrochelatase [Deltaproteobacteria bacterium]